MLTADHLQVQTLKKHLLDVFSTLKTETWRHYPKQSSTGYLPGVFVSKSELKEPQQLFKTINFHSLVKVLKSLRKTYWTNNFFGKPKTFATFQSPFKLFNE